MREPDPSSEDTATDAQLITLSQAGSLRAFQELVRRYQHRLFGLCYRLLGRHHDAEDASQEAFLRAYRALSRYDPGRPLDRWLLTIAANCCVSVLRRRRSRPDEVGPLPAEERADRAGSAASVPELAQAHEFAQALASAIAELPQTYRTPFVLFQQEDMRYEDIAQVLDLPLGTVKSRVHRAREQLYQRLSRAGFLEREDDQ